jgi:integrase
MPRDLPRFVARKTVHGHTYLYFRWQEVYRRLPDDPGSEAFRIEYSRALASISNKHESPVIGGSVRALLRDFKSAPEWRALAPKTQADYARVLDHLRPIGDFQADNVHRQHVIRLRNKMGTNRRTQDLFVAAVSRMFSVGIDLGYTDRNPAARIERLNDPESYEPWPVEARHRFEASQMPDWLRDAYMLALWTGQREGDVQRLARARFDGTGFMIRQGRPGAKRGKGRRGPVITLYVPAAAPLRSYLASRSFSSLLFVSDADGRAIKPDTSRKTMRTQLDAIGLTTLHFHGLRHTTATALAEAGCTALEIMALAGRPDVLTGGMNWARAFFQNGPSTKSLSHQVRQRLSVSFDTPINRLSCSARRSLSPLRRAVAKTTTAAQ